MTARTHTEIPRPHLTAILRFIWFALGGTGIIHVILFLTFLHTHIPTTPVQASESLSLSSTFLAWYFTTINVLLMLIFYGSSAIMIWRRTHDRISILVALFLIAFGSSPLESYFPIEATRVMAAYPVTRLTTPALGIVAFGGFSLFLFLFPDGRIVPRQARPVIAVVLLLVIWWALPPDSPYDPQNLPLPLFLLVSMMPLASMLTVVIYRYMRVSDARQRQQTKWVIYGASVMLLCNLIYWFLSGLLPIGDTPQPIVFLDLLGGIAEFSYALLPITIVISILRYRLWDIDVIIRRTLTYGAITILLGMTYFGGVIILQAIFTRVVGEESPLAVVASTLLIAALFNPIRQRVQAFVDRRFYRQKYDTQQTLEHFGDIARDEVVLEEIEQALVSTVNDTMQPEHISLWLRPADTTDRSTA